MWSPHGAAHRATAAFQETSHFVGSTTWTGTEGRARTRTTQPTCTRLCTPLENLHPRFWGGRKPILVLSQKSPSWYPRMISVSASQPEYKRTAFGLRFSWRNSLKCSKWIFGRLCKPGVAAATHFPTKQRSQSPKGFGRAGFPLLPIPYK